MPVRSADMIRAVNSTDLVELRSKSDFWTKWRDRRVMSFWGSQTVLLCDDKRAVNPHSWRGPKCRWSIAGDLFGLGETNEWKETTVLYDPVCWIPEWRGRAKAVVTAGTVLAWSAMNVEMWTKKVWDPHWQNSWWPRQRVASA